MVVRILSLKEAPKPVDSTDALALAICNIWRAGSTSKIEQALKQETNRVAKLVKK
jgi:crossover junction endodeoxyribonuclease RuvC